MCCGVQRLLHSATLAAATDPRTGRIDMDLINTGRSASSRDRTQQLIKEIKNEKNGALGEILKSGSVTFQELFDAVLQRTEISDISSQELQVPLGLRFRFYRIDISPPHELLRVPDVRCGFHRTRCGVGFRKQDWVDSGHCSRGLGSGCVVLASGKRF